MKERSALPQRILSLLGILGLALAFTAIQSPVVAAQQSASPDQEAAEQPSTPSTDEEIESLPQSPIEKAERDGTAIRLSLIDITKLALQNNIDIALQGKLGYVYQ